MDTPGLWSDITVHAYRWTQESDRFMQLLKLCLERGARHPLILSVHSGTLSSVQAQALFELLAEHSDRWERVSFLMAVDELKPFRPVDRGLDSLRSLSLELISVTEEEMADIGNVDIFEDASNLQHVHLSTYNVPFCPKLPWRQLRTFTYQGVYVTDLAPFMAFIGNLSHPEAAFELRDFNPARVDSILPLSPIRSTISSLLVVLDTYMAEHHQSTQALGQILGCLTLPHLRELHIPLQRAQTYWPVNQFESLSSRSSFYDTLRVLELSGIAITEDELVRSIVSLRCLEHLVVSEQRVIFSYTTRPENVLISDSLLLRLTWHSDKSDLSLVPQLRYFGCTSFCMFSAQVLFDFMASRVAPDKRPFQTIIRRLGDTYVEFEPQIFQRLQELVQKGDLRFELQ
jgi:hypothetical protein